MSILVQATKFVQTVPKSVLAILVTISMIGFFVVGFDQGHLFSLFYGESSFT